MAERDPRRNRSTSCSRLTSTSSRAMGDTDVLARAGIVVIGGTDADVMSRIAAALLTLCLRASVNVRLDASARHTVFDTPHEAP